MDATVISIGGRAIGIFQPSQAKLDRLAAWYDAEYSSLLRFAYFVCGDRSVAEDLVQEAFVRIYRAGARADEAGIGAYARRTVVNLNRSAFRRRQREHDVYARAGATGGVAPPDASARDEVWTAILTLSPRQRACVALRYYEDMSEKDVAEALGMSPGAVKKQTSRAMEKMRGLLGDRRRS